MSDSTAEPEVIRDFGGRKVVLSHGEKVIKRGRANCRISRVLWSAGPIAITDARLIWTPDFGEDFFRPRIIGREDVRDVEAYKPHLIDQLLGPESLWAIRTDSGDYVFGCGFKRNTNACPDEWIPAVREWARIS